MNKKGNPSLAERVITGKIPQSELEQPCTKISDIVNKSFFYGFIAGGGALACLWVFVVFSEKYSGLSHFINTVLAAVLSSSITGFFHVVF